MVACACARVCPSLVAELVLHEGSKAVLNISKPEAIKPVNYLSVNLVKASDQMLIAHLSGRLRLYMEAKLRLDECVSSMRPVCVAQKEELLRQAADTEVLVSGIRLAHEKELAECRARAREELDAAHTALTARVDHAQAQYHEEVRFPPARTQHPPKHEDALCLFTCTNFTA